jgi:crotonobetainyl-CoA:carnitine CoA-transferase CaiB-like acyl-CoA transferase
MTPTSTSSGALEGLKVVDLSRVLGGPYCTQILADHGADVLKIEPPQGDETRTWGPPFDEYGTASYFLGLNRNKRGMTMDLTQPAQREALLALLQDADVLVENFKAGSMEKWGLGFDTLSARLPRLIHCRVSGFGADSPKGGLPGYDAAVQAMVRMMSINGETDTNGGTPARLGVPAVNIATGLNAALGILMALHERTKSGRGQFVEATQYDCGLAFLHPHTANHLLDPSRVPGRSGNAHPNICPCDTIATGTVPIFLAVGNDGQFAKRAEQIGAPELASDVRFANNAQRSTNRVELKRLLEARLTTLDCEPIADRLIRAGVPCTPTRDIPAALADPHTAHRAMVVQIGDDMGVASPIKLSRTPATYRVEPPKRAGSQ